MFIPFHDDNPVRRVPFVTIAVIVANVVTFLLVHVFIGGEDPQGLRVRTILHRYGFLPARIHQVFDGNPQPIVLDMFPDADQLRKIGEVVPRLEDRTIILRPDAGELAISLITSLFLHGGVMHLLSNMWFFWIFGNNIEDRLGHMTFAMFYIFGGVVASVCHWLMVGPDGGTVPVIGASGAVAVILGAYAITYPFARVRTLIFLFIFLTVIELPALVVLGVWFMGQLLEGFGHMHLGISGGVAWWAHIGGFALGLLSMPLLAAGTPDPTEDWEYEARQQFDFGDRRPDH